MRFKWVPVIALVFMACTSGPLPDKGLESNINSLAPAQSEIQNSPQPQVSWWHPLVTDLSRHADAIVVGIIKDQRAASGRVDWLPRSMIITSNILSIEAYWKGSGPKTLIVNTSGGCHQDICMQQSHQASFEKGERALVFLKQVNKGWTVLHGETGKICLDGRYLRPETGEVEITEGELQSVVIEALQGDHSS